MSLHRDPGIKRMIGTIDTVRYWRYLLQRMSLAVVGLTCAAWGLPAAWRLLGRSFTGPPGKVVADLFLLAFCVLGSAMCYALYRLSRHQSPRTIAAFIPGDPGFEADPDISAEQWAALRSGPDEALLRDLYERPAARNRVADEAGEGPASSFQAFQAQAAKLRG